MKNILFSMNNIVSYIYFVIFISALVPNVFTQSRPEDNFYTGAVVEFANQFNNTRTPILNIEKNIDEYIKFIKAAKAGGADIVVFPECGISSIHMSDDPSQVLPYTSLIPDPTKKINPCNNIGRTESTRQWSVAIERISCEASASKIYVVINLPERYKDNSTQSEKWLIYNTNVVFDREGAIIARYRKYNLFKEFAFNKTDVAEITTFTTDFGVTFGTFTCFDILFAKPTLNLLRDTNVTDIVYPTAWFSELPFLTAVQTQAGWARAYGVNLLAAGYDDPQNYNGGSGIFSVESGILNATVPALKHSSILISKIPKITSKIANENRIYKTKQFKFQPQERSLLALKTLKDNFTFYTTEPIKTDVDNYKLCHKKLCCYFTVKMQKTEPTDYYYMMTVYDGPRLMGAQSVHVQFCGIVACSTDNKNSCGEKVPSKGNPQVFDEISIKAKFDASNNSFQFPSTALYTLIPLDFSQYNYKTEVKNGVKSIELSTTGSIDEVLTVGIYGKIDNSASYTSVASMLVVFLVVLNFINYI